MRLIKKLDRTGKIGTGDTVFTVCSAAEHNFEVAYETVLS